MLDYVREGDTLYIESISRLGRSTKDLLNTAIAFGYVADASLYYPQTLDVYIYLRNKSLTIVSYIKISTK